MDYGDHDPDDAFCPGDPDLADFTDAQLVDLERLAAGIDSLPTDDTRPAAVEAFAAKLAGEG